MKFYLNEEQVNTKQKILSYQDIMEMTGNKENANVNVHFVARIRKRNHKQDIEDYLFFNECIVVRRDMRVTVSW